MFTVKELGAICRFKLFMKEARDDSSCLTGNLVSQLDEKAIRLLDVKGQDADMMSTVGLILIKAVYSVKPSIDRILESGMRQMCTEIISLVSRPI